MSMNRVVVLICGSRKRRYPVPLGTELQDVYEIDGNRWTVVAVLSTEDIAVPILTEAQ